MTVFTSLIFDVLVLVVIHQTEPLHQGIHSDTAALDKSGATGATTFVLFNGMKSLVLILRVMIIAIAIII